MARNDSFECKANEILNAVKDEIDWLHNEEVGIILDGDDLCRALYKDRNALEELGRAFLDVLGSYSGTDVFDEVAEEYWDNYEAEEEDSEEFWDKYEDEED